MTPDQRKGLHGSCPTVIVKTDAGPVTINEEDFDPKVHAKYDDEPKDLTVKELKELLTSKGVAFASDATKAELLALAKS